MSVARDVHSTRILLCWCLTPLFCLKPLEQYRWTHSQANVTHLSMHVDRNKRSLIRRLERYQLSSTAHSKLPCSNKSMLSDISADCCLSQSETNVRPDSAMAPPDRTHPGGFHTHGAPGLDLTPLKSPSPPPGHYSDCWPDVLRPQAHHRVPPLRRPERPGPPPAPQRAFPPAPVHHPGQSSGSCSIA